MRDIVERMEGIPNSNWVSEWIYAPLLDEDENEIAGGCFFSYKNIALWNCVNQLGVMHNSSNLSEYNHQIIDRIIDALYYGDWISQMRAISNMEQIDCFDPDYITYLRWVSNDDCTYENWITEREEYWNEQGYASVKQYAKFALWRVDNYGEIPAVLKQGYDASDAFFQSNIPETPNSEYIFDKLFDINDYQTGYDDTPIKRETLNIAPKKILLPSPITKEKSLVLPNPSGKNNIIDNNKKEEKPVKRVQQRLF